MKKRYENNEYESLADLEAESLKTDFWKLLIVLLDCFIISISNIGSF